MGDIVKLFELYNEYQAILSLLKGKPHKLIEDTRIINITMRDGFDLDLLENIGSTVKYFDLCCNPFSDEYDDIIEELQSGIKSITDITYISIIVEKDVIEEINNIQHVFFDKHSAINCVKKVKNRENANKINIGIINNENIETELFNFVNLTAGVHYEDVPVKEIDPEVAKHIDFYLSNNRSNDHSFYFNPYSFVLKKSLDSSSEFIDMIKKEFYKITLESLSDKEESGSFIIRGDKNISIVSNEHFSIVNYKEFLDIFTFLISHQKFTEKFIITKKVISLYVHDKETISDLDEKLPEIWKTINHYYNHYIEDNIKDFFKTKDQLLKEAMNVSKVIYEQTDKISNSIIASIISILILLVTTLYRSFQHLNIFYASLLMLIFFIFSCVYFHLMSSSSKKRYDLTSKQFDHFISEVSLIQKEEVKVIRKIYLENPYKELKNTLQNLLFLLIFINSVLLIAFLVFICFEYNYCLC